MITKKKMTKMTIQKGTKAVIATELIILATTLVSVNVFLNAELSFLSAFLIILGSMFSYKKTIANRLKDRSITQTKDDYEKLNDPFELYDEEDEREIDQVDIKNIIKEEKKRLKADNYNNLKLSAGASFSIFRIVPYIFLVIVFILLSHSHRLMLEIFLPFLAVGVAIGYVNAKDIFID